MITTPHKLSTPAAKLTPKEFVAEYERLARRVEQAEKMPGRKMTQAEVALWQKDWKAFSRLRGYTADEIAEYERWLDMHCGFKETRRRILTRMVFIHLWHIISS